MPAPRYTLFEDGTITSNLTNQTVQDTDPAYVAYIKNGGAVIKKRSSDDATIAAINLAADKQWGYDLAAQVQEQLALSGINNNPAEALELYRYLAEVRDALKGGLLHVAWAILDEILAKPQQTRPAAATDALLQPIQAAIAARLGL